MGRDVSSRCANHIKRVAGCLIALGITIPAAAGPLDEGSCERLRMEQEALTVLGIDRYFNNGADWVKSNLTSADMNLVQRYVNVFEQLKFRCPERVAGKTGPVPPMPVPSPNRPERTAEPEPAQAATPG